MKKPIARVSDHAVLRYLQRVLEVPVEAIRDDLGRKLDDAVRAGASSVVIDGFRFVLDQDVVTTVLRGKGDYWPMDEARRAKVKRPRRVAARDEAADA